MTFDLHRRSISILKSPYSYNDDDRKYSDYAALLRNSPDNAIVIDNGSYFCKAGWSTEEYPRLIFPSVAAKSRATATTSSNGKLPESFAGNDLHLVEPSDRTQIKSPFENGLILSIQTQEYVFDHVFSRLGVSDSKVAHPIVCSEPLAVPNQCRQELSELLFEVYGVPSICYGVDALFAWQLEVGLDASAIRDGISISFGHSATQIVPILNAQPLRKHIRRLDIGGQQYCDTMSKLLHISAPVHKNVNQMCMIVVS